MKNNHLRLLLLLLFLFFFQNLFGQKRNNALSSLSKIKQLIEQGDAYQNNQPDTAIYFYNQALQTSQEIEADSFTAELWMKKAIAVDIKGGAEIALSLYEKAMEGFRQTGNDLGIGRTELNIGVAYNDKGLFDEAMEHYWKAYQIFENINEPGYKAKTLNNIAILYRLQDKLDRAVEIYMEALQIKESLDDTLGVAITLMNLGYLYQHLGDFDKMDSNFQFAIQKFKELENAENIGNCYLIWGQAYFNNNRLEEAKTYLEKALEYYEPRSFHRNYNLIIANLGKIAIEQEKYNEAIVLLEEGLEKVRKSSRLEVLQEMLLHLSTAYNETNQLKKAYNSIAEAYTIRDSLTKEKRLELTEELQTQFDVAQKDNELKIQKMELQQQEQNERLYWLGLGAAFLVILGGIFFLFQKNKHVRLLAEKNKVIKQALDDKDLLMKEIHHRVKNNLQFISSLLNLQARYIKNDKAVLALKESRNRIKSMSLLHLFLYQKNHFSDINMKDYLEKLVETIMASYEKEDRIVALEQNLSPVLLDIEQAVAIGLIVNELANNAFKHAYEDVANGQLKVTFSPKSDSLLLQVRDNGKGFDKPLSELQHSSFGYKLVFLLTEKLKAKCHIENKNGAVISIHIPL